MNKEEENSQGEGVSDFLHNALLEELLELGIDTEEKWDEFVEQDSGIEEKTS